MHQYEAMVLFDAGFASEFARAEEEVNRLMDRAEAELLFCRKWEERRLAHEVKGRKRGTYVLAYFKAAPDKVRGLERDAQLSESVLRLLVLRADHATPEKMEQFAPQASQPAATPDESKGEGPAEADAAEDKPAEGDAGAPGSEEAVTDDAEATPVAVTEDEAAPESPEGEIEPTS